MVNDTSYMVLFGLLLGYNTNGFFLMILLTKQNTVSVTIYLHVLTIQISLIRVLALKLIDQNIFLRVDKIDFFVVFTQKFPNIM